jgi:hypothetical protein
MLVQAAAFPDVLTLPSRPLLSGLLAARWITGNHSRRGTIDAGRD